jgi:hypothetical protein
VGFLNENRAAWLVLCLVAISGVLLPLTCDAFAQTAAADTSIVKAVGTIKNVQADSITLAAEPTGEVTAKISASTKILRVPPGEKDLKNATPLQAQDLQPGDRVLVRGPAAPDAHTIAALAVIVMKQADVSAKQQQERDDWQKRGAGGLVTKVDAAGGTVTISTGGFGATKSVLVHISKNTILRRYAPDSIKFDDAKPAPLDQIKVGDQLRARGGRSQDGSELTADEVVSGTFRNIAGTVTAMEVASNSITVKDLIAKNTVVVNLSPDSQMKKLPPEMAQRIAMRLKASAGADASHDAAGVQNTSSENQAPNNGQTRRGAASSEAGGQGNGPASNAPPDFQRMLSRLPGSKLADLQKGDAVMIVSTEAGDSGAVTAITLLAGVEPILTAAPNRSASLLSAWSLNPSGGGEGESAP